MRYYLYHNLVLVNDDVHLGHRSATQWLRKWHYLDCPARVQAYDNGVIEVIVEGAVSFTFMPKELPHEKVVR